MKNKQAYWTKASFALLAFVFVGYVVKFYPERLVAFDSPIQIAVRGALPQVLTTFFKSLTIIGNPEIQVVTVTILVLALFLKGFKIEAFWLAINGSLAGTLILVLKSIYARPRPEILHLIKVGGFSFPSGHSLGAMLIFGTLIIIAHQRLKNHVSRLPILIGLASLIVLIGLSRIYLGVHYPSDVLSGFVLGYGLLNLGFPTYDQKRFEWRFQSKQK